MKEIQWNSEGPNLIILGDNLNALKFFPDHSLQLIYIDPPFNTGRVQKRTSVKTVRSPNGSRVGFQGMRYETIRSSATQYDDVFLDYWAFLEPRLAEAWRLLSDTGTLYLHLDYREVHYAKVFLDSIFGRECFLNEIIWAYDYGGKTKRKWPPKHDNILVYVKNPSKYIFNSELIDREPYMAPGLVSKEKASNGKLPTDVWWHTIVSPTGKEKTGYATQKPIGILRRILQASSNENDWVMDFFCGSGTLGVAAKELNRKFILIDKSETAIEITKNRLRSKAGSEETDYYSAI